MTNSPTPSARCDRAAGERAKLEVSAPPPPVRRPWFRSALLHAALSSLLLWLALPPLGWSGLVWIAPCGWLLVVRDPSQRGRSFYRNQWLVSLGFWLAFLQGIRLAHPALYLGWFALSAYLAVFTPAFIAIARIAVHRLRVPLIMAAPVIWTGLELFRAYFLTGFAGGMLGHPLAAWTVHIQIADLGGAYAVSALVMLVAACLTELIRPLGKARADGAEPADAHHAGGRFAWRQRLVALTTLAAALAGTAVYGNGRLAAAPIATPGAKRLRVLLVQESVDTIFEYNEERNRTTFEKFRRATLDACRAHGGLDLVVWPESVFTENSPEILVADPQIREQIAPRLRAFTAKGEVLVREIHDAQPTSTSSPRATWFLGGTVTIDGTQPGREPAEYNSALLFTPEGAVTSRYYKRHLVMFGEYIPLGRQFPILHRMAGMSGAAAGEQAVAFDVKGWQLSPSICFESMVPHVIRRQIGELRAAGHDPDILINLTNDGWFWGSSILDMHYQAGVFRAVESRRPLLVAANTGITTWIDGSGRTIAKSPRRQRDVIVADVVRDTRQSPYQRYGDLPAGLCLAVSAAMVVIGWKRRPTIPPS